MADAKINPEKIKAKMIEWDVTQLQLSRATGFKPYQVSQLVTGKRKDIKLSTAKKFCEVFECTLDELFGDN